MTSEKKVVKKKSFNISMLTQNYLQSAREKKLLFTHNLRGIIRKQD